MINGWHLETDTKVALKRDIREREKERERERERE